MTGLRRLFPVVIGQGAVSRGLTISGSVGVSGATVSLGAYSTTSTVGGSYTLSKIPVGTSGTLNVSKSGYAFTPARKRVRAMDSSITENFTAVQIISTYYVRKTGNDDTGDGSTGNPWLTIQKAMGAVPTDSGVVIKVGNGTYQENWDGYLYVFRSYTLCIVEPESGVLGDAIIQATNPGFYSMRIENGDNVRFSKMEIGPNQWAVYVLGSASGIEFIDCDLSAAPTADSRSVVDISRASGLTFDGCAFILSGASSFASIINILASTSGAVSNLLITNCSFPEPVGPSIGAVIQVEAEYHVSTPGAVSGEISNCTIAHDTSTFVLRFGRDDYTLQGPITFNVYDCTITGVNHVFFFGMGSDASLVDNCTISSIGSYCLLLKECVDVEVSNCAITGGSDSAVYFKASLRSNLHDCVLNAPAGVCFRTYRNTVSGNKVTDWQFKNNTLNVSGTGKALSIGGDDDDGGGGICDYNSYESNSGLGAVRSDADVQSLAELQAAWLDYDVTTNDSHSVVV